MAFQVTLYKAGIDPETDAQMGFITREQMVTAMNAWVLAKTTPLGELLRSQGALDAASAYALEREAFGGARKSAVDGNRMEGLELGVSHIVQTDGQHKNIRFD